MGDIHVTPMTVVGGGLVPPGKYAVIKQEEWDTFAEHYHEVFDERDKALDLGMKLSEGTKYHDSMVKFVRWTFRQLKEIMRAEENGMRVEMPRPKEILNKLYDLRLADQTYCGPDEVDGEYEYTPDDSRWTIHLHDDLKEEHEHGKDTRCDGEEGTEGEEGGDIPEEGTP